MLSSIISSLFTLKKPDATSAELRADLEKLDIAGAEAENAKLETDRHALLLLADRESEIDQLDLRIQRSQREIERRYALKAEFERKIKSAQEREHAADIVAKIAEGRALQRQMIAAYIDFDEAAIKLAETLTMINAQHGDLEKVNAWLAENGRGEDRAETPRQLLAARGVSQDDMPRSESWRMPGYFPLGGKRPFALARGLLTETSNG